MRQLVGSVALAGILGAGFSAPASALRFDFAWGPEFVSSGITAVDGTQITATGTIDIDAAPGESFVTSDITASDILVSGDAIIDFTMDLSYWQLEETGVSSSAFGSIAADGLSATFDLGDGTQAPVALGEGGGIACALDDCSDNTIYITFNYLLDDGSTDRSVATRSYDTTEDALGSLRMSRSAVVSLPAALPLMLAGLAGLGYLSRRRLG